MAGIESFTAQFAQPALERRIGIAETESADLLPPSLDLGLKFAPVIPEIIERGDNLLLSQSGETRSYLPDIATVCESIDHYLDDSHLFSLDPGDSVAVQFDCRSRIF
jgi:hypothetical protein